MRLVLMSDTHSQHRKIKDVPAGDVIIHCGDALGRGTEAELIDFAEWYGALPHSRKLLTAGNHDWIYEQNLPRARQIVESNGITLLHDSGVEINGINFYGAPWTPQFFNWAFMLDRGSELAAKWALIPENTHVLITHGPPYGHGDAAPGRNGPPRMVGCLELLQRVRRVQPLLHCFGHIHEGYGATLSDEISTLFVNAAICDGNYVPNRAPIALDIDPAKVRGGA